MKKAGKLEQEKICKNGHTFIKLAGSKGCPICNLGAEYTALWWKNIGAPARKALIAKKWNTLAILQLKTEDELLKLHGVGPKAVKIIAEELRKK